MLLFLDESAVNTAMVKDSGRCPRGERLVDSAPAGLWQTSTMVAAIGLDGVVAPMVIDGPLNGESFAQYVETSLGPGTGTGEHRRDGQSSGPQKQAGGERARSSRMHAGLSSAVFAGLQPDREHVVKIKTLLRAAAAARSKRS